MNRNLLFYGGVAFLLLLTALLLFAVRAIAIPFLLALLLAYFLDPAVDAMERRRLPRVVAVTLVFALFLLAVAGFGFYLVPSLKKEMVELKAALPRYAEGLYGLLPSSVLSLFGVTGRPDLQSLLDKLLEGAQSLSFDVVSQSVHFLSRAFSSTLGFILAVLGYFITPVYLFYLLKDFDRLVEGGLSLVPLRLRGRVQSLGGEVDAVMSGFIRGQLTVCMLLAVLYSAGLYAIGVDLALVIGITSGLAFIIPYLGTILGIVLAGTMAAVEFRDLLHPLLVLGWFCLVQGLEGTVISPKLVGNRVGLHPLTTILAVLAGGELFGFLGLLLAVPVTASANVILKDMLGRYRQSRLYACGEGEEHARD